MKPGILVVSEVFPPAIGGSGALLENVYRRMKNTRVRVLASEVPPGVPPYPGPLQVERLRMSAIDWGIVRPSSLRRHLRVAKAIGKALDQERAIVHCARALPEGLSAAMALMSRPGRYVCWLHGEELGYASTSRELRFLARRVYHGAAAVIANSYNSRDLLVRDWGVSDARVQVVHPGVDTDRYRPDVDGRALRARAASNDAVLFLSVGRLQRRKGHDMVLRALASLRKTVPNVRYAIVGDGPHQSQLQADARALGIMDIVHFAGSASEADLPRWYAASDVFVMPNRTDGVDFEGFGIVFLEAAAAGLPVIGGRSGGAPEAIADNVTGLLVDGANPVELEHAMAAMASSRDVRRRFGLAGRNRALLQFSWDRAAQEVENACVVMPGS